MGYAKTEAGAKRKVAMKRALRKMGISIPSDISNEKLENLYCNYLNKAPPSYEKYK